MLDGKEECMLLPQVFFFFFKDRGIIFVYMFVCVPMCASTCAHIC